MYKFLSLKDHVYNYIAEEILKGSLVPEEKINESKICQELNISRTPVREALIQLASEGVLVNVPRKGFLIKSVTPKEAENIYAVIGVLDGFAASLACPFLTEKHMKDMEFYLDSMDLSIKSNHYEMYYKQQETFHSLYINECRNDLLIEMINLTRNKFLTKSYDLSQNEDEKQILYNTNAEHRKIVQLFKEKKSEELAKYLQHVHWNPAMSYSEKTNKSS